MIDMTPAVVPWQRLVVVDVEDTALDGFSRRYLLLFLLVLAIPVPAGDDERIVSCLARNFRTDP